MEQNLYDYIRDVLIPKGKSGIKTALETLLKHSGFSDDNEVKNKLAHLRGRYQNNENSNNNGTVKRESYNRTLNELSEHLVQYLDILREEYPELKVWIKNSITKTINVARDKRASAENLSLSIGIDNTILNKTAAELEILENRINRGLSNYVGATPQDKLTYDVYFEDNKTTISPKLKYLDSFKNKFPLESLDKLSVWGTEAPPYYLVQHPNFDIKIVNNSDQTVFFNKIVFEIEQSQIDPTPLFAVAAPFEAFVVNVYKESWNNLVNCYVEYDIYPLDTPQFDYTKYAYKKTLDNINADFMSSIDISEDLISNGLDPDKITESTSGTDGFSIRTPSLLGKFKPQNDEILKTTDYALIVAGTLYYSWKAENGTIINENIPFNSPVYPFSILGGYEESSFQYQTMFKSEGANYKVVENISQWLKPNEVNRFNILVGGDKSSIHKFKVKLFYNGNNYIESEPINLTLFFPYSYRAALDELKETNKNRIISQRIESNFKVWADKVILKENSDIESKVIMNIPKGTVVYLTGEKSSKKIPVKLQGNSYVDYLFKVKTSAGVLGWIHGSSIKNTFNED